MSLVAGGSCDTKFRGHLFAVSIDGSATIERSALLSRIFVVRYAIERFLADRRRGLKNRATRERRRVATASEREEEEGETEGEREGQGIKRRLEFSEFSEM